MDDKPFKYVFGPVPSRRLGRSLGVDLVPYKTCTYDCVYCQLGVTTAKTVKRKEYAPLDEVLAEIDRKLASGVTPDYITLSGSGEPTLYSRLGELIIAVKAKTDIPVAVITNGSLLSDPEVRGALIGADLVAPSLDAADAESFRRVNRPHAAITFDEMVAGLVAFRERFAGQLWLEVFLLDGVTATEDYVRKLATCIDRIRPDRIQLNTVVRPPAEASASAVPRERMERFAEMLGDNAEVIAGFEQASRRREVCATRDDVLDMLRRRPCSLDDIAQGLGLSRSDARKHLDRLEVKPA